MKTYDVEGTITISVHCQVVADNPEEARAKAEQMDLDRSLARHYSSKMKPTEEWCTSGELDDDEPQITSITEQGSSR